MSEIADILIERAVRAVSERRYCADFGLDAMPPELSEHFNRSAVPACVETDVRAALEAVAAADLYEALVYARDNIGDPVPIGRRHVARKIDAALARARGDVR